MAGPGTIERIDIGPTTNTVRVSAAQTGGRASVVEMQLPAGWVGPPAHRHGGVDHVWLVTAGAVDLTVDGATWRAGPGNCTHVPAGAAHGFSTEHTDGATVVQVDTPGALDGYLRDLAAAFPPGSTPVPAVIAEIMGRHDTEVVRD